MDVDAADENVGEDEVDVVDEHVKYDDDTVPHRAAMTLFFDINSPKLVEENFSNPGVRPITEEAEEEEEEEDEEEEIMTGHLSADKDLCSGENSFLVSRPELRMRLT